MSLDAKITKKQRIEPQPTIVDGVIQETKHHVATIGGGPFWILEAVFRRIRGVQAVFVGYIDGKELFPTFEIVSQGDSGHGEVCKIFFDPAKVSFKTILNVFYLVHDAKSINASGMFIGSQYRSMIVTHNDNQAEEAKMFVNKGGLSIFDQALRDQQLQAGLKKLKVSQKTDIKTKIVSEQDAGHFYTAEEYLQDYYRKNKDSQFYKINVQEKLNLLKSKPYFLQEPILNNQEYSGFLKHEIYGAVPELWNPYDSVPPQLKDYFYCKQVPPDLSTYSAIGFSLDSVLIQFNKEYLKFKIKMAFEYLQRELDYPEEITEFDYEKDIKLARAGVIWDIELGTILRLSEHKRIMKALCGFTQYSEEQIQDLYGEPPILKNMNEFKGQKDQAMIWNIQSENESFVVPIICHIISLIKQGSLEKTYTDVAFDIKQLLYEMNRSDSEFMTKVIAEPELYVAPEPALKSTLEMLKPTFLFLVTNYSFKVTQKLMAYALGEKWVDLFDKIITSAQTPLFFNSQNSFSSIDLKETEQIGDKKFYTKGNSTDLQKWIDQKTNKEGKTCYFQNQMHAHSKWDAIQVIPELMFVRGGGSVDDRISTEKWFLYPEGQRDYYLSNVEKQARYVVSVVSDISTWVPKLLQPSDLHRKSGILKFGDKLPKQSKKRPEEGQFKVEDRTDEDGYIILHPKKEHEFTLIWLHGLGEQPEGFKDIFIDERLCKVPDSCKVVIPLAPIRQVTANGSEEMYCWFDIKNFKSRPSLNITETFLQEKYDQAHIQESVEIIHKIIDQEVIALNDPMRVFIGGFSQGAAIAIAAFLKYDGGRLGGVWGSNGAHSASINWSKIDVQEKRKTPMFFWLGSDDPLTPPSYALQSYKNMQRAGLDNYNYLVEPSLTHSLSGRGLKKLSEFLCGLMQSLQKPSQKKQEQKKVEEPLDTESDEENDFMRHPDFDLYTVKLPGGIIIQIDKAEAQEEDVDAVTVYSAMQQNGGRIGLQDSTMLKSQRQEEVDKIQEQYDAYYHPKPKLSNVGQVYFSDAVDFKAQFKIVAIAPTYDEYASRNENQNELTKMLKNILNLANGPLKCKSISISTLPLHAFLYPEGMIAQIYIDQIIKFSSARVKDLEQNPEKYEKNKISNSLEFIRLTADDEAGVEVLQKEFDIRFPENKRKKGKCGVDVEEYKDVIYEVYGQAFKIGTPALTVEVAKYGASLVSLSFKRG